MDADHADDLYESTLDESSKKRAKDELNEINAEDRKIAVRTLRRWVLQQDWLKIPTDFRFLLRFLRARKYSQLEARRTLEMYWTSRQKRPLWHRDLDPTDPILQEIYRNKICFSPLKRDKDGCRLVFVKSGELSGSEIDRIGVTNLRRAMVMFMEWVCFDENVQVNGVNALFDHTDLKLGTVMKFADRDDQKQSFNFYTKATPARIRGIYVYNEPTFYDVVHTMYFIFASKKILDRVHILGKNMTKAYEKICPSMLPGEYLPDDYSGPSTGPESQIIEDMITDMTSPKFRNYVREVTSSKYGIDFSKKTASDDGEAASSFRKLNV